MKKIFSSWIGLTFFLVIFALCSYWIYKNISFNELFGQYNLNLVGENDVVDTE
ncbi:MAG TPA: hypothetical protein PL121_01795 [bacterium]|jgi:hypothetical protein|nr:hypothetical protein [bacterium]